LQNTQNLIAPPSGFSYAALARVVTAADTDAGRLHLAETVVDCMRTYTSLCGSVRAVATAELLQLLQLRRLPPAFISHCVRRLDPSECGFVNSSVVREFLCACNILRVSTPGLMQSRVHLVEKSVYSQWLKRMQVCVCMTSALHILGMILGQDDVVALQSPGGGGWRQLDDARSKMYDFVKTHVIIMMSSFPSPLKIFLLTLCACLFGTTSALASAVGQPLMQLEAEL
jgi:hypothetical protein